MALKFNAIAAVVARYFSRLRFPQLLVILLILLVVDFATPDPIPLVDEVLLAVGALLVGSLRKPRDGEDA